MFYRDMRENWFSKYRILIILLLWKGSSLPIDIVLLFLKCCGVCHWILPCKQIFYRSRFELNEYFIHIFHRNCFVYSSTLILNRFVTTQTDVQHSVKISALWKISANNHKSIQSTFQTFYVWGQNLERDCFASQQSVTCKPFTPN